MSLTHHHHAFQATRWTLVARAIKDDAPAARAALDELCRLYWPPLFAFARRRGLNEADAEDITQSFFAELLRGEKFALADPERGKLRSFLLHTFSRRLLNHYQRDPARATLSLDAAQEDAHAAPQHLADPHTPEKEFNRQWAITTMDAALSRLAAEYEQMGKASFFDACRPLLSLDASGGDDYAAIAARLGIKEGALRVAAHRLRQRFRDVLFATVADTLDDPDEATVRTEISLLIESLV